MAKSSELNNYISLRYERWLDYAKYHCRLRKMDGEEYDVLNEVLTSVLQKDPDKLIKLMNTPKDGYTELDWFVLATINRNITSPSSPWQQKRVCRNIDRNIDYTRISKIDVEEEEEDRAETILNKMRRVRDILDNLKLSEIAKKIFAFKFFNGEPLSAWKGNEDKAFVYSTYNQVEQMVKEKLKGGLLF